MNPKAIFIMILVSALSMSQEINTIDVQEKCNSCSTMLSKGDCTVFGGCTWNSGLGYCAKAQNVTVIATEVGYCPGLKDRRKCSQTYGCAFVDGRCTPFAGCSAYIMSTNQACLDISYRCLSNGAVCIDAYQCELQESCTSDQNGRKCTLDSETKLCRNFKCDEADNFSTDIECDRFSAGCVTTGFGCVTNPLPVCAKLIGTQETCPLMTGSDGRCQYDKDQACSVKLCSDAPNTFKRDSDCEQFQFGCVTNGKGCVRQLRTCAQYSVQNPKSDCEGLIGTDGTCEEDPGKQKCRSLVCENFTGKTDVECQNYKKGCLTNGKQCVVNLGKCQDYIGTISECTGLVGSDGNCTGQSDTSQQACRLMDCVQDSTVTFTKDEQCQAIQLNCLTTGAGCVSKLESCNTYTAVQQDGQDCYNRVGSEGNCKFSGSGNQCAPRVCEEAPKEYQFPSGCAIYRKGCVYSGAKCINQTSCIDAVTPQACSGTGQSESSCFWSSQCVDNSSCLKFSTKEVCISSSIVIVKDKRNTPCIWQNNFCRISTCSDFKGDEYKTNEACDAVLSSCVSNGFGCADPSDCTQFKGDRSTCQGFKALCTNLDSSDSSQSCIPRSCENASKTLKLNQDCINYLPNCLTNGAGCVDKSAPCNYYIGLQTDCAQFTGYVDSKTRIKCWSNITSGQPYWCQNIKCSFAIGMKNNNDCEDFLSGCIYNGNGSCVKPNAQCSDYGYPTGQETVCQNFNVKNGSTTISCWAGSNNRCKNQECSDYKYYSAKKAAPNNEDCDAFLKGCLTKGDGCIAPTEPCTSYTGTSETCKQFVGNYLSCSQNICQGKTKCSNKSSNVLSNADCLAYHTKCRQTRQGATSCQQASFHCSSYQISSTASISEKTRYCEEITTVEGGKCGFSFGSFCAAKSCSTWQKGISIGLCQNYMGNDTCIENQNVCYEKKSSCLLYQIPFELLNLTAGQEWCQNMKTIHGMPCFSGFSDFSCSNYQLCKSLIQPTSSAECNQLTQRSYCQFYKSDQSSYCVDTPFSCTLQNKNNCELLKASDSNISEWNVQLCYWDEQNNQCKKRLSLMSGATSQEFCDKLFSSSTYYKGACYLSEQCTRIEIPTQFSDNNSKRLFCQNMIIKDPFEQPVVCSYNDGDNKCSQPLTDCGQVKQTSIADCGRYRLGTKLACYYYGKGPRCGEPIPDVCKAITGIGPTESCDLYTRVGACHNNNGTCQLNGWCYNKSYTNDISADSKAIDCQQFIDQHGQYCSWNGVNNACSIAPFSCSDWDGLVSTDDQQNLVFCESRIDINGKKCTYDLGATQCRTILSCELIKSPQSNVDCFYYAKGCSYNFNDQSCYAHKAYCHQYRAKGESEEDKLNYCSGMRDGFNPCQYIKGSTTCYRIANCADYAVSHYENPELKLKICSTLKAYNKYGCTYFDGNTCSDINYCSQFSVTAPTGLRTICSNQIDRYGKKCVGDENATSCYSYTKCEDILSPTLQSDCDKYVDSCIFILNKCITKVSDCQYKVNGLKSISDCANYFDLSTGEQCTATSDTATVCQLKTCNDPNIPNSTTNAGCAAYKSSCKSDGYKCIDGSTPCEKIQAVDCLIALDFDNKSTCSDNCSDKPCELNQIAQTDAECNEFSRGCVTKGVGCISSQASCSSYYGTIEECSKFKGSDGICYGTSQNHSVACKVRQCSDNNTAQTNSECEQFLHGCLTTLNGCISAKEPCSSYSGNNSSCRQFKGLSGKQKCYGQSESVHGPCRNQQCTDLQSASDSDCAAFMQLSDSVQVSCVSDGQKCVPSTTLCKDFTGTDVTCPKFKAFDRPCKATNPAGGSCTKSSCTDAPNNYSTDQECQSYNPNCVTTGKGCIATDIYSCKYVQTQAACGAKSACFWFSKCRVTPSICSQMTADGQFQCTNTPLSNGKRCKWNENTCRDYTCADYDATLNTHQACNELDSTCTTNGAGCVTQSTCKTYNTAAVCSFAQTTEASLYCTWDQQTSECRQRQCTDNIIATSDSECNEFLSGCKTVGAGCIGQKDTYKCDVFSGYESLCLTDSSGYPCLYVDGICYNYAQCTDAIAFTLVDCQKFNRLCVPSASSCIPQTSCDKYKSAIECTVGINNTICGWLPSGQCQAFGACEDALGGTTDSICSLYGSSCLSDGSNCLTKGNCSSYLTQAACTSLVGATDGQCIWVPSETSGVCRLAVCSDFIATTHRECAAFKAINGECTTNGTSCIARLSCIYYDASDIACTIGSDGIECIYSFPLGQTSGSKICRRKECSDITGRTNEQCNGQVMGRKCVSNGNNCIEQDKCSTYTNKISCSGGGSDGICVFTPGITQNGTCVLFTSCEIAKNDQNICNSNPSCLYYQTTSGKNTTTTCTSKTCSQQSANSCNNIQSFDGMKQTLCTVQNGICTESDPSTLTSLTCYKDSVNTYTWSESLQKCVSCTRGETAIIENKYILGLTLQLAILVLYG